MTMATGEKVFAGVDIGGTSVKVGTVTARGKILARAQEAYEPDSRHPQDVVDLATAVLDKLLCKVRSVQDGKPINGYVDNMLTDAVKLLMTCQENMSLGDVSGESVGCPSVVEDCGVVHAGSALNWGAVPLQRMFADRLNKPVTVCNDADAAVLAEQWVGSAKGDIKTFTMLTLGTGVGFGAVINGQLARGGQNIVEGGHLIVERNGRLCSCTQTGCLEAYSSGGALVARVKENLLAGKLRCYSNVLKHSVLYRKKSSVAGHPDSEIAEVIFKHAADGDELCKSLVDEAADSMSFACVNYARMMDPEVTIVLTGEQCSAQF
ncbi:hypothetical protein ON010_g6292 [Phytophthora cinnamomi]|nr:hypothetical protein ON010_g6292 [Phytophthora cinnamomi]